MCNNHKPSDIILSRHAAFVLLQRIAESRPMVLERDEIERSEQSPQSLFPLLGFKLTLPHLHHVPSHTLEPQTSLMVSLAVVLYLFRPIVNISLWHAVHRAALVAMPKTSVDEDASAQSHNDHIWSSRQRASMYAITKTMAEQKTAHNHLWPSVSRPYLAHALAALLGCHLVCHSSCDCTLILFDKNNVRYELKRKVKSGISKNTALTLSCRDDQTRTGDHTPPRRVR